MKGGRHDLNTVDLAVCCRSRCPGVSHRSNLQHRPVCISYLPKNLKEADADSLSKTADPRSWNDLLLASRHRTSTLLVDNGRRSGFAGAGETSSEPNLNVPFTLYKPLILSSCALAIASKESILAHLRRVERLRGTGASSQLHKRRMADSDDQPAVIT